MKLAFLLLLGAIAAPAAAAPTVLAPAEILASDPPGLAITGLAPGSRVRVHALRRVTLAAANGQPERPVVVHAWADFVADRLGLVKPGEMAPLAGTWSDVDPLGLMWSGWPAGDARLEGVGEEGLGAESLSDNRALLVTVEVDGTRLPPQRIAFRPADRGLDISDLTVAADGVSGVLAIPLERKRLLPAIIELHGSEGGSMAAARSRAITLASRGYAVLALNYVAYAYGGPGIAGVPTTFVNLPVELLDRARLALIKRPGIDPRRIALAGGSKGAEFALVGAATYPWVKAVVGCVPSDIVWSGFGRAAEPGEMLSSWSVAGKPLPAVAYDRYEDVFSGKASAAEVHRRSRVLASAALLRQARIPVEKIRAPVLLLGSGNDEVWQSAEMATTVAASLRRARGARAVELATFPDAGHGICGTGASAVRAGGQDNAATTQAAGSAFRRTLAFLNRTLRPAN